MTEDMERLERRLEELRRQLRQAVGGGDHARAKGLRAELRGAERAWDQALAQLDEDPPQVQAEPRAAGPLLPVRELVHQALGLLGVAAAPRLISAVHGAFFAGQLVSTRLTSLRRDEERSFRAAPYARPYYICAALTADLLAPARGLLAVSTMPLERRVIGPLSSRVDFLIAAINLAERTSQTEELGLPARRLLWRFAANIPAAAASLRGMVPTEVASAARAELAIHAADDDARRAAAAQRARAQLSGAEQLFGAKLWIASQPGIA